MKKMKKIVNVCVLSLSLLSISQNLLVELMRIVDFYGEKTNTCVVEEIDNLNTIWYFLEDLK